MISQAGFHIMSRCDSLSAMNNSYYRRKKAFSKTSAQLRHTTHTQFCAHFWNCVVMHLNPYCWTLKPMRFVPNWETTVAHHEMHVFRTKRNEGKQTCARLKKGQFVVFCWKKQSHLFPLFRIEFPQQQSADFRCFWEHLFSFPGSWCNFWYINPTCNQN